MGFSVKSCCSSKNVSARETGLNKKSPFAQIIVFPPALPIDFPAQTDSQLRRPDHFMRPLSTDVPRMIVSSDWDEPCFVARYVMAVLKPPHRVRVQSHYDSPKSFERDFTLFHFCRTTY